MCLFILVGALAAELQLTQKQAITVNIALNDCLQDPCLFFGVALSRFLIVFEHLVNRSTLPICGLSWIVLPLFECCLRLWYSATHN